MSTALPAHRDPKHRWNGPQYHTGKPCIERGCEEPAGTAWSPHWCKRHNAERLDRVSGQLDELAAPREDS